MTYRVDKFNGSFLTSVDDGTIDTTTDLRFIGKNYAGYGEVQNENFLHLLENFANTSAPPKAIAGQIWYDSSIKKLKYFDGTQFKTTSGAQASLSAPSGLSTGEFWYDTSTDQLYTWNGTEYILIGPENTPELSSTAVVAATVKDNLNTNHTILKVNVNDETIGIISRTEFILNSSLNPISGFNPPASKIKKGFNLINTDGTTGITTTDHYFWGTTSNSIRFAGRPVSDFVLQSDLGSFGDAGFTVGDQNDIRMWVENGDVPVIENQLGGTNPNASIVLRIRTSGGNRDAIIVQANQVTPGIDNFFSLGSSSARWSELYAVNVIGDVTGNLTGDSTGSHTGDLKDGSGIVKFEASSGTFYGIFGTAGNPGTFTGGFTGNLTGTASNSTRLGGLTTDESAVANTISVRNSSGNLIANQFVGTADKADRLKIDNSATDSDPNYRSAKTTPTPNTIVARDSSGNVDAVIFNGTATAAQYADLAEKYLADEDYDIGTVVVIGGEAEITASSFGKRAIGVISGNPAFMMNSELENGVYVALKGRVPVKVVGSIKKGDNLIASDNGCAMKSVHHSSEVFAIALESSDDSAEKIIEAVIL